MSSLFGEDDIIYDDDVSSNDDRFFDGDDPSLSPPFSEGLSEARKSTFVLGHDDHESQFLELFEKNALPHAMIFSGLEGIGKTTMAFRLARFLLKNGARDTGQGGLFGDDAPQNFMSLDVSADDPVFARVASGGHADLLHIERYFDDTKGKRDASLKVEALRKIEPFLRKTSSEGGWRVVLIEDADTMNRNAQNAILKILEEPPENVLIILIAHRPSMLIPTIRSRARVLPFSPLSSDHMKDLLSRQGVSLGMDDMSALSDLSEGSIGQALRYTEEGGLDMLSKVLDYLDVFPDWDWEAIHKLSSSLSTTAQDQDYRLFVHIMQWVFGKMLFLKGRGFDVLPSYLDRQGVQRIFDRLSLENLVSVCDGLREHFDRVEFSNLDRRDAVRAAFLVIDG